MELVWGVGPMARRRAWKPLGILLALALAAVGLDITRPINDWCANGDEPGPSGICPDGTLPGPAVAEGWDDWGPFYAPMYHQHVGLNSSTVEMCSGTSCGGVSGNAPSRVSTSFAAAGAECAVMSLAPIRRGSTGRPP